MSASVSWVKVKIVYKSRTARFQAHYRRFNSRSLYVNFNNGTNRSTQPYKLVWDNFLNFLRIVWGLKDEQKGELSIGFYPNILCLAPNMSRLNKHFFFYSKRQCLFLKLNFMLIYTTQYEIANVHIRVIKKRLTLYICPKYKPEWLNMIFVSK